MVISGNQWGDKMPEDKDTLEYWLDDIQITDEARGSWTSDMEHLEYKLEYSSNQKAIKFQIEELKERVAECTAELNEYAQKIFGRPAEVEEMETLLKDNLQKIYQKETVSLLSEYGKSSMFVRLSYKSKTTDILDDFHDSKKKFLIFQELCRFYDPDSGRYAYIDLIVSEEADCPYKETSCPTMTEIKKISDLFITPDSLDVPQRLIPLGEEIIKVVTKHKKIETPFTSVFWKPFELGGISYSDRYWIGMPVGEVSSYYAVGITVKEKLWGIN